MQTLFVITLICAVAYFAHFLMPRKQLVNPVTPPQTSPTLMQDIGEILDAIERAVNLSMIAYATALLEDFEKRYRKIEGIEDDVKELWRTLEMKRNTINVKGLSKV